uniref:D-isomer specific 2-hydroxyacid dehydrogenase catalytic domain-containing protein n=1 Tax=Physcomitrium patens TaxID=3218 RepID=A0A7I4FQH9_PHYPA
MARRGLSLLRGGFAALGPNRHRFCFDSAALASQTFSGTRSTCDLALFRGTLALTQAKRAMGEAVAHNQLKPLRILFCGDEFPAAEFYTRKNLQQYPHLHLDSCPRTLVADRIGDYDICVPRMMRLDAEVIARAKQLQLIVQFGVGLEGVDIEAATRAGIKVARIPSVNTGNALACAEHCIYMMLGLLRHQRVMASSIAAKRLGEPAGSTLYGKTIFILGYGHIGKELALRLRYFGVHLLAVRRSWTSLRGSQNGALPNTSDDEDFVNEKGGSERILEFASRADIVVTKG